jgi:hypothetical protein
MKISIALGMTLVANIVGLLVPSNAVLAATVFHHGSICHSLNQSQAKDLVINTEGVRNIATATRKVICPLVVTHTPGQTTGGVLVDNRTQVPLSTSISCTLYSYDFVGSFLGSTTNTSGFNSYITLSGVPANIFSNHTVVCSLPPNSSGRLIGIESAF